MQVESTSKPMLTMDEVESINMYPPPPPSPPPPQFHTFPKNLSWRVLLPVSFAVPILQKERSSSIDCSSFLCSC